MAGAVDAGERIWDVAVVGAGIAGASAAYELQARGETVLLEREALPGHHTTGRSAAFLVESYGTPVIRRLIRAGRDFLEAPPEGFSEHPLLGARPCVYFARADQLPRLDAMACADARDGRVLRRLPLAELLERCPTLRPGYAAGALVEERACSIDVAGLLGAYVRGFRARGGALRSGFELQALEREGPHWRLSDGQHELRARAVVNAAGAWAEDVGRRAGAVAVGLQPLRRTALTFDPPPGADHRRWPCLIDADEDFYLKPDGPLLLASPCDETPSPPCDPSPAEIDVATAIDRVERAFALRVRALRRQWAGLRTFAPDRLPVLGEDPRRGGFYWHAGQGGFGIMTSPGTARALAGLVFDGALPERHEALGLKPEALSPRRFL